MLPRTDAVHASGAYTTVGGAYGAVAQGHNWAGARTGVGTSTITLSEEIDATERVVLLSTGTAGTYAVYNAGGSADATVLVVCETDASAPAEAIVHFTVLRIAP